MIGAVPQARRIAALCVFGATASHPGTPPVEAGAFEISAHERDDLRFAKSETRLDRIKRCAVLPRHLDDPRRRLCCHDHRLCFADAKARTSAVYSNDLTGHPTGIS